MSGTGTNTFERSGVPEPGTILAGKYRVERVLGVGGMGVVVQAHHLQLDMRVALKFLLPEMVVSDEAVARFAREARAAVQIKSEHVARVSDVGTLENGAPYMVMEFLEGGDLADRLKQQGALPVEQAVEFVLQACEALAEAHALGITHRDLKPANLFVIRRPDGSLGVKVLDFGISKVRTLGSSQSDASMTKTSAIMGSPLYMSPEQMQSAKDADSRADIWALGIILYELVSGQSPFFSESLTELIAKILSTVPVPLRNQRPDAPEGLEAVILRCLEKDRDRRYESVGELAGALLPFAPKRGRISVERISGILRSSGLSASALALPPSSDPSEPARAVGTGASWGRTNASAGSGKGGWVMGLIAVAIVFAAGGAWFAKRGLSTPEPEALASQAPAVTSLPASLSVAASARPADAQTLDRSAEAVASVALPVTSVAPALPSRNASVAPRVAALPLPVAVNPTPKPVKVDAGSPKKRTASSLIDDRR